MEICYRREMKRNYLVAEPRAQDRLGYERGMLVSNHIEGLLRFYIKYADEKQYYYYDITSMQPLKRLLEGRFITKDQIQSLMLQIQGTLNRMENYFLTEDGLLLEPEYIYVEPQEFRLGLCLIPGAEGDFPGEMSRLLQYLMKKVDHRDKDSVVLAYGLYQESLKENYGMDDLMGLLARETEDSKAPGEEDEPEAKKDPGPDSRQEPEEPREHPDAVSEWKPEKKKGKSLLALAVYQLALVGGGAVLFLLRGQRFFLGCLPVLLAMSAAGLVFFLVWTVLSCRTFTGSRRQEAEPEETEDQWMAPKPEPVFQTPQETRETGAKPGRWEISMEEEETKTAVPVPSAFQTTLLAEERPEPILRRLESRNPGYGDIPIPYFPFIIGKHPELADYVLEKDTVSRLHLRLDQEEDRYLVTDLNSTNGTWAGEHELEANETVPLCLGEELVIADLRYIFR